MKTLLNILFIAIIINPVFSVNDTLKTDSKIKAVTIFLNGAEINRVKGVALTAGRHIVEFTELSPNIYSKNIRLSVGNGVSLLSITNKSTKLSVPSKLRKEIKQKKDSVILINNKIALLNNEKNAYQTEMNLLLKNNYIGTKESGVSILELQKAADFYRSRTKEINDKMHGVDVKITKLNIVLLKLNQAFIAKSYKAQKNSSSIVIEVICDKTGTFNFDMKYYVSNAGWMPSYDIKAKEIGKNIDFYYNAKVYNNTGIDWNNVNLKLSTADPSQGATKPSLTPWTLNYSSSNSYEGYYQQQYVGDTEKESNRAYIAGEEIAADVITVDNPTTSVAVSELSSEFEIKTPYSIPANAKPYMLEVKEFNLPAEYKYIAIPKIDRDAFLLARISGWEDLDIISGNANVYMGNTYIGQSYINTRFVEDTLDLSLGRDNKVLVTRSKKQDFNSKKIIGTNRKETYTYELIVKNNRKVPIDIEINDQLPVSQESDIDVGILAISEAIHDDLSGKLTWEYKLQAGESKKMTISFSIKYPKNRTVKTRKYRTVSCAMF